MNGNIRKFLAKSAELLPPTGVTELNLGIVSDSVYEEIVDLLGVRRPDVQILADGRACHGVRGEWDGLVVSAQVSREATPESLKEARRQAQVRRCL